MPAGTVIAFAAETCPTGFLPCDGSALSTTTYPALAAVIGTAFGNPGAGQFNLPDLRGSFVRGWSDAATVDPDRNTRTALNAGGAVGNHVGTLQGDMFESHNHTGGASTNDVNSPSSQGYPAGNNHNTFRTSDRVAAFQINVSASGGSETRPRNVYLNYCIRF